MIWFPYMDIIFKDIDAKCKVVLQRHRQAALTEAQLRKVAAAVSEEEASHVAVACGGLSGT